MASIPIPSLPPRTKISILPSDFISNDDMARCAELFSSHYGNWGANGPAPGRPVRLSAERLQRDYVFNKDCFLVMAESKEGNLVGHAFACRFPFRHGYGCWITQLVVHKDWRGNGLATEILCKCCSFKNCVAWGLVSSHPHAVRALERATKKKAIPDVIASYAKEMAHSSGVPYLRDCQFTLNAESCLAHTNFFVDHTEVEMYLDLEKEGSNWKLGRIGAGDEFVAVITDF